VASCDAGTDDDARNRTAIFEQSDHPWRARYRPHTRRSWSRFRRGTWTAGPWCT